MIIDDAMGDEDDEEESDAVVNQVLDELGLQLGDQLSDVPTTGGTLAAPAGKAKTAVPTGADVSLFWHLLLYQFDWVCDIL